MPSRELLSRQFNEICEAAEEQSRQWECVRHVNCRVGFDNNGLPCVEGFVISDWCDGSTIRSYSNGNEA